MQWDDDDLVQQTARIARPVTRSYTQSRTPLFYRAASAATAPQPLASRPLTAATGRERLTRHPFARRRAFSAFLAQARLPHAGLRPNLGAYDDAGGATTTRSADSDSSGNALATALAAPPDVPAALVLPQPASSHEHLLDWVSVGVADTIGRRPAMEDCVLAVKHTTPSRKRLWLFAVLDGHGGSRAAQLVAERWPPLLFSMLNMARQLSDAKIKHALRESVLRVNDVLHRALCAEGRPLDVGTTLCALLVADGARLFSVNVGDSRALAVNADGTLHGALTNDHKPSRPDEKRRIEQLGGRVLIIDGVPRVQGNLAVSRALGDFPSAPFVSGEPEIGGPMPLHGLGALVLCCDGVTDVLDDARVAALVGRQTAAGGPRRAAEAVRDQAYRAMSGDNISVLVVNLAARANNQAF